MYSSVKSYFPDYDGDDQDFNAARNYFKHRFCRLNRSQTKEIYPSFTNATDTGLLKIVMVRCGRVLRRERARADEIELQASVTDIILTTSLRDIM
jgi:guanine nucleotide-binding protein subunit alpha